MRSDVTDPERVERVERVRGRAHAALAVARHEARRGSIDRAWRACRDAAALGRELGDAEIMAAATTTITGPELASWSLTASRQALCIEALAMIGDRREDLRALVAAQLASLASAWTVAAAEGSAGGADVQREFLLLQAEHAAATGAAGVDDRLAVASRLLALGRSAVDDEASAWAHLWRLDTFQELGLRVEFNGELMVLRAVVERSDSPVWRWRLAAIDACIALMEDRLDDVPALAESARDAGRAAGAPDAPFIDLVLRDEFAQCTGRGGGARRARLGPRAAVAA